MKTLQIQITDKEYLKYNFQEKKELTFADLEELISVEYAKKALLKCNKIAKQNGLSKMTMEEINAEINAVRDPKNNTGH